MGKKSEALGGMNGRSHDFCNIIDDLSFSEIVLALLLVVFNKAKSAFNKGKKEKRNENTFDHKSILSLS